TAPAAWQRAVRLLAQRDRSTAEIRARLEAAGHRPTIIAATIARLHELRYLSDERFAETAAARAAQRGHGSERVRAELAAKGVAESVIAVGIAAAFAAEPALAHVVLSRRFPTLPATAPERAKAARFLLQRGFPEAVVLAILGEGC